MHRTSPLRLASVLVLNSVEDSGKHFVIVTDKLDEFFPSFHQKRAFPWMDCIGRTNGCRDELIARGFLNAHEKPQEPKVRCDTTHFQRLTDMHKAMQPGWLRW